MKTKSHLSIIAILVPLVSFTEDRHKELTDGGHQLVDDFRTKAHDNIKQVSAFKFNFTNREEYLELVETWKDLYSDASIDRMMNRVLDRQTESLNGKGRHESAKRFEAREETAALREQMKDVQADIQILLGHQINYKTLTYRDMLRLMLQARKAMKLEANRQWEAAHRGNENVNPAEGVAAVQNAVEKAQSKSDPAYQEYMAALNRCEKDAEKVRSTWNGNVPGIVDVYTAGNSVANLHLEVTVTEASQLEAVPKEFNGWKVTRRVASAPAVK